METIVLFGIVLTWFAFSESSLFKSLPKLKQYRPTDDIRIALNAMKNFGRFAIIFAVLYWIQVQFGDVEVWLDAFQRN